MSENKQSNTGTGIGFGGLLTIVFITLKLLGKIDWSWWWVLSPTLIPFALVALFFIGVGIYYLVTAKSRKKKEEQEWKFLEKLEDAMKESEKTRNSN